MDFLNTINSSRETVVFFCNCEIEYSGRAEAFLERGDRVIMIKADKNILIHQPENSAPINYMKAGTAFNVDGDILTAKNGKEILTIRIYQIYDSMTKELKDGRKLELAGSEADMSDMIKNNPEIISDDFKPLSREEHTKFGFIDVFGHDNKGNLIVVECKRYSAGLSAVQQLRRYVEKIKDLKDVEAKGIIASPAITPNALEMLKKWNFKWVEVHPPKRLERYNKDQSSLADF